MTRGERRQRRTRRGYSLGVTLGFLAGLLPLPVLLHLMPQPPGPIATPLPYSALRGHTGWVNSVDYSPDGQYVATGSDDGTAILWDAATGDELVTLQGHTDAVDPVLFSHDGQYLVSASLDGTARLWTVPDGECIAIMAGDGEPIYDIALLQTEAPDGRTAERLITAGARGHLKGWRLPQGDLIGNVLIGGDWTMAGFVSVSHHRLERGDYLEVWLDGPLPSAIAVEQAYLEGLCALQLRSLHQTIDGQPRRSPAWRVTALASTGSTTVAGGADGSLRLLGCGADRAMLPTGVDQQSLVGHTDRVESLAFHGPTNRVASAAQDNTVRVWDLSTRRCLAVLRTAGPGIHDAWIERHSVSFSPDGKRLATAQGYIARIHELPEQAPTAGPR